MHAMSLRATAAAILIAFSTLAGPAAAQFIESSPAFKQRSGDRKPAQRQEAPPAVEAPAAFAPPPESQVAPQVERTASPVAVTAPAKPGHRAPYPPPNDNCRNTESFASWLARFKKDAAAAGIRPRTINSVLDGMGIDRKVISRDRGQKFFAQSFWTFQGKLATQNRVVSGKKKIAQRRAVFDRAQRDYGVPASVITGFWALESDFGAGMGKFPIMPALVTLAYDCRRQVMFQEELKAAMQIIDRGDMTPGQMIGSWAGEIGQTQFLPTRYLDHAIDYDGDGRIDLFRDDADVIGSTANYMKHLGWRANEPWLEEVVITRDLPWEQADLAIKLPRSQWNAWGLKYRDGSPVPKDNMPASLLLPMGRNGPAFLAYPNFDIYTEWNNSLTYATTAAYLATRIDGAPAMSHGRGHVPDLSDADTKEVQRLLAARGYDVGKIDGLVGEKTRAAVKEMQLKFKMPADSYPTPEFLSALRRSR
jgi:lytic murein transglycosylase